MFCQRALCHLPLRGRLMSTAVSQMRAIVGNQLEGIKEAGTYKSERIITSKQDAKIKVGDTSGILNFCANNYLGLSSHPEVIKASHEALELRGSGLSSVRFICGTQDIHKELEAKIAKFHGKDDAILYISCFDANAGIFEALLTDQDAVISDALNHASIIDGIRLCKAKRLRYNHMDMADLEAKLKEAKNCRMKMIVTDGVFSMDGDIAPLKEIRALANKYNALLFSDECHATGFMGKTGRGTDEHCGVEVDIINSTLGKALGGAAGGYTAGPQELIDLLRNKARPYLFSNTLPPAVVGSASKVFDILMQGSDLTEKLKANTERFRSKMNAAGFTLSGDPAHPICPVMLGDAKLASALSDALLEQGIYVIGFSYPVVPQGKARIRVQLSAVHTTEDIDRTVDAFIKEGRKLGVIA